MKTGKFVSRIIVLLLIFFLTTAGAAQALNISECKGECCRNIPIKSHHKVSVNGLSAHPSIEFEALTLLCDPIHQFRMLSSKTPAPKNCHHETVPLCCEMTQVSDKVEGLISTALSRVDRPLENGPMCILSEIHATDNTLNIASARYSIPARAKPTPLYLKNSAFLC
jgi:hypothetical protein